MLFSKQKLDATVNYFIHCMTISVDLCNVERFYNNCFSFAKVSYYTTVNFDSEFSDYLHIIGFSLLRKTVD